MASTLAAFYKFYSYVYYENSDLLLRKQLSEFISNGGIKRLEKNVDSLVNDPKNLEIYLSQIRLKYFPKKVSYKDHTTNHNLKANFISNIPYSNVSVDRIFIFTEIPIELHVISVMWLMDFGYVLDRNLSDYSIGNRLILKNGEIIKKDRSLFKRYIRQYQKWWSGALSAAQRLLSNNEDVTIVNFDLKDFFHSIELDFNILELEISKELNEETNFINSSLHLVFKEIHIKYNNILKKDFPHKPNNGNYSLPINVISSFVLANWYLDKFDNFITKEINPIYYSRYVDDFIMVIKNSIIKTFEQNEKNKIIDFFKINKISIDSNSPHLNLFNYFVAYKLDSIIKPFIKEENSQEDIYYKIAFGKLDNLEIQKEKIFIYQFDASLSPTLIDKFINEQKERSSEFRFLSDEEDSSDSFEENIFNSTFEDNDNPKSKIKQLSDSKFKISVYLAKIINRKINSQPKYKEEESTKILKYFKGINIIKHYYFWEKIFTLFLAENNKKYFEEFYYEVESSIDELEIANSELSNALELLKKDMRDYLVISAEMALSLNPNFVTKLGLSPHHFRKSFLLRKQYVCHPLLQLTEKSINEPISLIDYNIFSSNKWTADDFKINSELLIPFVIKFWEVTLHQYRKKLSTIDKKPSEIRTDYLNVDGTFNKVLDEAFEIFFKLNHPFDDDFYRETLQSKYFEKYTDFGEAEKRKDILVTEIYLPPKDSEIKKDKFNICLINKYIDLKEDEKSLEGNPFINKNRVEIFNNALDQILEISEVDMFVMSELALPHDLIPMFVTFAEKNQIGFITGLEHFFSNNIIYNFLLTCLPVNVNGVNDAIINLRLKNHYAPEEEEWIRGKFLTVPIPKPYNYYLFEWRGIYFSPYNCFELGNIKHRSLFYSKIDLIVAPIWTRDTHYYNSIVDSITRDLHCYVVQVNTSQYGETRTSRPTDHIRRDKTHVKGGTSHDYSVFILKSELEIKSLRNFQKHDYNAQKIMNKDKKSFKPTPPDFPRENVEKRIKNERFFDKGTESI